MMLLFRRLYYILAVLGLLVLSVALLGRGVYACLAGEGFWQTCLYLGASTGADAAVALALRRGRAAFKGGA